MLIRLVLAAFLLMPAAAQAAGSMDRMLAKLAPEDRAHQACAIKGLPIVKRDPRLRKADRIQSSTLGRAVLDGTHLAAKGGAVRVGQHWYAVSFTCDLTPDYMKAQNFSFVMGKEIPKENWDALGLWP